MSEQSPLTFPCEFVVKVMGKSGSGIESIARTIIEKHAGPIEEAQIRERPSSNSRFVGYSFTIHATSREQVDEIYRELTARPEVLMAL